VPFQVTREPVEMRQQAKTKTQIVVVGGGAGGLELMTRLGRRFGRDARFDIILVERNRTHIWKPLLHEVAAGALDANLDEVGYGNHAYRWGYRFFLGALEDIDREHGDVVIAPMTDVDGSELLGRHRIRYDYLVFSVGSVSNDFGTPGVRDHCLFLDQRSEAERFRQKLLNHCLRVSRELAVDGNSDAFVDIAIVGGGATGVELAAELYNAAGALRHYGLEVFDESRMRVTLLEAGPRILPALPEKLAQAAHEELEALGVRVLTGTAVTEVSAGVVHTSDGQAIPADLKVWVAGVKGADVLSGICGLETNRIGGRMAIEGRLARFVYISLYGMHLLAIHGRLRGLLMIVVAQVNHVVRPRLKLH
jgi:NADH dehydrogenase